MVAMHGKEIPDSDNTDTLCRLPSNLGQIK